MTRLYLILQIAAFWPVWRWYLERVMDASDEPWGVLALVTAVFFIALRGRNGKPGPAGLALSAAALVLYIVLYPKLPPLARGVLAMASLCGVVSPASLGRSMHIGVLGLLLLSLPIIASLQFYLGYPVRALTSMIASQIISTAGYPTEAYGTMLKWAGEYIAVDAPCSGIKMLWTGLYLNFTLACFTGLGQLRTWFSYACSGLAIFTGNMLRVTALFFLESGIVKGPKWAHEALGLFFFGIVALLIIALNRKLVRSGHEIT
jgi:exosortase/archaeosortase family protein